MRDDYDEPIRYVSDQILCEPHGVVGDRGIREPAYPDDNPKTVHGVKKTPLHLIPPVAKAALAWVMGLGAKKYGAYNWREKRVSVSVYKAAAERHLDACWAGEWLDPESGQPHVAHAMACCAILLDAAANKSLNDDRPRPLSNITPLDESVETLSCPSFGANYDNQKEKDGRSQGAQQEGQR
jgi:hypothetical protein